MKIAKRIYPLFLSMSRSISRITLDEILNSYFAKLPEGRVLEMGAGKYPLYRKKIGSTVYHTLDVRKENEPDICGDIHEVPIQDESVDIIIATEVLEHCHSPGRAMDEIYRVLTEDGICILSTRFIYKKHGSPHDYYRFTDEALSYLFQKFRTREIKVHGNMLGAVWDLLYQKDWPWRILFFINCPLRVLLFWNSSSCPCGYVVYARK